jgi:hypothetical protein
MGYLDDGCIITISVKQNKKVKKSKKTVTAKRRLVAHHRHTGRALPREHTSYALLAFITLCVGVVLTGVTASANAALLTLKGTVPGVAPTEPAVITSPADGTHFTAVPIDVSGTCPTETIVRLYRNNVFSGETFCDTNGAFSIESDLFEGENTLKARIFNYGETEGPESDTIKVVYDIPPAAALPTAQKQQPSAQAPITQLVLTGENKYQGYNVGETASWHLRIEGGVGPYNLALNWGDGSSDTLTRTDKGEFTISHIYKKASRANSWFVAKIGATDSIGQSATLQFVTIVNSAKVVASTDNNDDSLQTLQLVKKQLLLGWPLYIVTVLMLVSFWLGERRGAVVTNHKITRKYPGPQNLRHA